MLPPAITRARQAALVRAGMPLRSYTAVAGGRAWRVIRLYSNLLLHDMGEGLADGFAQGSANGREFRTMPLWRVSDRTRFLHDGRSTTIVDAIHQHGGQAAASVAAFDTLTPADQDALLSFVRCL